MGGDSIGCGEEDFCLDWLGFAVLKELAFVEDGEEAVEDRAVGGKYFIDEDQFCFGEFSLSFSEVFSFFEGVDVDRSEDFVWFGKFCQEVGEDLFFFESESQGELGDQGGFSCSRGADEEEGFPCDSGEGHHFDRIGSSDELALEGADERADFLSCGRDGEIFCSFH